MKLSTFVAVDAWVSFFILIWLCLLGRIDPVTWVIVMGVLFFLIAVVASMIHTMPEKIYPKKG